MFVSSIDFCTARRDILTAIWKLCFVFFLHEFNDRANDANPLDI